MQCELSIRRTPKELLTLVRLRTLQTQSQSAYLLCSPVSRGSHYRKLFWGHDKEQRHDIREHGFGCEWTRERDFWETFITWHPHWSRRCSRFERDGIRCCLRACLTSPATRTIQAMVTNCSGKAWTWLRSSGPCNFACNRLRRLQTCRLVQHLYASVGFEPYSKVCFQVCSSTAVRELISQIATAKSLYQFTCLLLCRGQPAGRRCIRRLGGNNLMLSVGCNWGLTCRFFLLLL